MRKLCDGSGTDHGHVTQPELLKLQKKKSSVSRWVCKNWRRTNSLCNLPDVLVIGGIKEIELGGLLLQSARYFLILSAASSFSVLFTSFLVLQKCILEFADVFKCISISGRNPWKETFVLKNPRTEKVSQFETLRGPVLHSMVLLHMVRVSKWISHWCNSEMNCKILVNQNSSSCGKTHLRPFDSSESLYNPLWCKTSRSVPISRGVQIPAIDIVIPHTPAARISKDEQNGGDRHASTWSDEFPDWWLLHLPPGQVLLHERDVRSTP